MRDGNLEATKSFFATHPGAQLAEISPGKTTINLAIEYGQVDIIKWLLETTPSDALERKVKPQEITPLHVTVATKNIEVAKILVERNRRLLLIPDCWNRVPLAMAGLSRQVEMVHYFYKETPIDQLDHQTRATILNDCVIGEIYGKVELRLLELNIHRGFERISICLVIRIFKSEFSFTNFYELLRLTVSYFGNLIILLSYVTLFKFNNIIYRCCFGYTPTLQRLGFYSRLYWPICP